MIIETITVVIGTVASVVSLWEYAQKHRARRTHASVTQPPGVAPSTGKTPAGNLPSHLASFVGREREVSEVRALMGESRLLTLTGAGGCGKTRLAIYAAGGNADAYPDGVWLVELASISTADAVPQAIAAVLRISEESGRPIIETVRDALRAKRLLLVLDNCEHLLSPCAAAAETILHGAPSVKIVVTSREALGIVGEMTFRVPSLSIPAAGNAVDAQNIEQYESARLLIERARFSQPGFTVTDENAEAIAQVCRQLDGIPLAIELAAARVQALPMEQIAERLNDSFRLLTGGSRTALPRQQTLRATIDWSYEMLSVDESTLMRRLAVFTGGWTLEAAETVCSDATLSANDILDALSHLVQKSLVQLDGVGSSTRYHMLETVRQYSCDRLSECGGLNEARRQHAAYFMTVAREAATGLRGPEQAAWLTRLTLEHDNLRTALDWCLSPAAPPAAATDMAGSLWRFWQYKGLLTEGRDALLAALDRDRCPDGPERAEALNGLGVMLLEGGAAQVANDYFKQSLNIRRAMGDEAGAAHVLNNLGISANRRGDTAGGRTYLEEALGINRRLGNTALVAMNLGNLARIAKGQGRYSEAREEAEESLAIQRAAGNRVGQADNLDNLGEIAASHNDLASAEKYYLEAVELCRELGNRGREANILSRLGEVAFLGGRYAEARRRVAECLDILRDFPNPLYEGSALMCLGRVACAEEQWDEASRTLGSAMEIFVATNTGSAMLEALEAMAVLAAAMCEDRRAALLFAAADASRAAVDRPLPPGEKLEHERAVQQTRERLGDEQYKECVAEGTSLTLEEAAALAIRN